MSNTDIIILIYCEQYRRLVYCGQHTTRKKSVMGQKGGRKELIRWTNTERTRHQIMRGFDRPDFLQNTEQQKEKK